jgi:hypothetical protein
VPSGNAPFLKIRESRNVGAGMAKELISNGMNRKGNWKDKNPVAVFLRCFGPSNIVVSIFFEIFLSYIGDLRASTHGTAAAAAASNRKVESRVQNLTEE